MQARAQQGFRRFQQEAYDDHVTGQAILHLRFRGQAFDLQAGL